MTTTAIYPPRSSVDSTAHLLGSPTTNTRSSRPASIVPSISSSLSDATTVTAPTHLQRGFKSQESYLAALNEFADSQLYMQPNEYTLHGWYGTKTTEDYKQQLSLKEERKKQKKEGVKAEEARRRKTLGELPKADDGLRRIRTECCGGTEVNELSAVESTKSEKEGRLRRLSRVLTGDRRTSFA